MNFPVPPGLPDDAPSAIEVDWSPSNQPGRDPTCMICLADISETENTRTHTACFHTTHADCLQRWLDVQQSTVDNATCPMCRQAYSFGSEMRQFFINLTENIVSEVSTYFWMLEMGQDEGLLYRFRLQETFVHHSLHPLSVDTIPTLIETRPLQRFSDALDNIYYDIISLLNARVKTLRGQAEDMIVQGTQWDEVKIQAEIEWGIFEVNFMQYFYDFWMKAHEARMAIIDAETTHIASSAATPSSELLHRMALHAARDEALASIQEFDFNLVDTASGLRITQMFVRHRHKEQIDYHARTGQWGPSRDVPGAYVGDGEFDLAGDW